MYVNDLEWELLKKEEISTKLSMLFMRKIKVEVRRKSHVFAKAEALQWTENQFPMCADNLICDVVF